jgi:hypothetical protein
LNSPPYPAKQPQHNLALATFEQIWNKPPPCP